MKKIKYLVDRKATVVIPTFADERVGDFPCWGCNENGADTCYILDEPKHTYYRYFKLCKSCVTSNELNKYIDCTYCGKYFYVDFTNLKPGSVLDGGRCAFTYCDKCLQTVEYHRGCPQFGYVANNLCAGGDGDSDSDVDSDDGSESDSNQSGDT